MSLSHLEFNNLFTSPYAPRHRARDYGANDDAAPPSELTGMAVKVSEIGNETLTSRPEDFKGGIIVIEPNKKNYGAHRFMVMKPREDGTTMMAAGELPPLLSSAIHTYLSQKRLTVQGQSNLIEGKLLSLPELEKNLIEGLQSYFVNVPENNKKRQNYLDGLCAEIEQEMKIDPVLIAWDAPSLSPLELKYMEARAMAYDIAMNTEASSTYGMRNYKIPEKDDFENVFKEEYKKLLVPIFEEQLAIKTAAELKEKQVKESFSKVLGEIKARGKEKEVKESFSNVLGEIKDRGIANQLAITMMKGYVKQLRDEIASYAKPESKPTTGFTSYLASKLSGTSNAREIKKEIDELNILVKKDDLRGALEKINKIATNVNSIKKSFFKKDPPYKQKVLALLSELKDSKPLAPYKNALRNVPEVADQNVALSTKRRMK